MVKTFLKTGWREITSSARRLFSPLRYEIEEHLERRLPQKYWKVVKKFAKNYPVHYTNPVWTAYALASFVDKPSQEGVQPRELEQSWKVLTKEILPLLQRDESVHDGLFMYHEAHNFNRHPDLLGIVARELLPHIHIGYYSDLGRALHTYFEKEKPSVEHVQRQIGLTKQYFATGKYFFEKVAVNNFGKLGAIGVGTRRYNFPKAGGGIIPLGGKLHGYIIRTLPREAYEAWLKAHQAGLQVEEILHVRGKPRAYTAANGRMRVYTRFAGEYLTKFIAKNRHHVKEVQRQIEQIKTGLIGLGIEHGHFDNNLVVELVQSKPVVRLIDFDQARLKAAKPPA